MTQFNEDLAKISKEAYYHPRSDTLLDKYGIPIQKLDFQYINKCDNGKELEKIYKILVSGEEGFYPDLTQATEDRLSIVYPKSKILRKVTPVISSEALDKEEQTNIISDLDKWLHSISKCDNELENRPTNFIDNTIDIRKNINHSEKIIAKPNDKRISATDYQSWDKYDPETEILKMDLDDEKNKKEATKKQIVAKKKKKSVKFNEFATEAEAIFVSEREREKGNEYFRAGDYEEALHCYSNSIQSKTSAKNLNNRAATYLKLKKYSEAVDDCESVLLLEPENEKALLRKAEALMALEEFKEALNVTYSAIKINSNNSNAQELANKLKSKCCIEERKPMRMTITEVSSDEDDD